MNKLGYSTRNDIIIIEELSILYIFFVVTLFEVETFTGCKINNKHESRKQGH